MAQVVNVQKHFTLISIRRPTLGVARISASPRSRYREPYLFSIVTASCPVAGYLHAAFRRDVPLSVTH